MGRENSLSITGTGKRVKSGLPELLGKATAIGLGGLVVYKGAMLFIGLANLALPLAVIGGGLVAFKAFKKRSR